MPPDTSRVVKSRALVSWSGGKDSAWALHLLRQSDEYEIVGLLTTVNQRFQRIAIHGVRESLLAQQAEAIGLPLWKVELPFPCSNDEYEARMRVVFERAKDEGVEAVVFGDLFLEDIRAYRERLLQPAGLLAVFPVWGLPTADLAGEMIRAGVRATIVTIDPRRLDPAYVGRSFDAQLLFDLPEDIDRCGERGEFHTFVWDGPMFAHPIAITLGEFVERDGFWYADLVSAANVAL